MTRMEAWSVSGLMVATAGVAVCVVVCVGYLLGAGSVAEAVRLGAMGVGLHGVASLAAGLVVGGIWGPGVAVGGHLGMYNLATPVAVWARVRWLNRNRPGFLPGGFLVLLLGCWAGLLGVGVTAGLIIVRM